MKKLIVLILLSSVIILPFCTTSKRAMSDKNAHTTYYDHDVAPILATHCTPCHFPEQGGKKLPLDTYNAASNHVDSILYRVQLPTDHPRFMPFKMKKPPLTDSLINVIKVWKAEGLAESMPAMKE